MKALLPTVAFFILAHSLLWVYERDTFKILDVNKAALACYGYTRTELLCLTILDLCPKDEVSRVLDAHKGLLNDDENLFLGTFSHQTKYGELLPMQINGHTIDFNGTSCIVSFHQSGHIVVNHQSVISQMVDSSLDVFCTINELGNFEYVSAASLYHWGYLPEELKGIPYMNLVLDEDVPKTFEIATSILNGNDVKSFVNRYKKKNGGIAYNFWSVRWDETLKKMYCVARDGAEKIKQEEKTKLSEQRFKSLVQEGSDLIRILDVKGNFIYVSPTSASILGMEPEEFIGKKFT